MTPFEREQFYDLSRKFKKEKRVKELIGFKGQLKFLGLLVGFLIFLLVVIHLI
jgi:acid phosphatase family membrane protein YuiD